MNSLWTRRWVNSVTVLFWDCAERRARCALIVKTHIYTNRYISARLLSACTLWFHLSIPQTERTSGSAFSPSLCFVCAYSFASYKRRRLRQILLPSLKYEEKETRRIEFDWTWITEHYLNVTQDKRSGCDPTLGSWLHAERCLLHADNAQCFSGSSFVLVWAFYFWHENLDSDSNQPLFWSQSGASRPITVLAD